MFVSALINPKYNSVSGIYDVLSSIVNEQNDTLFLPKNKHTENYQILEEMADCLKIKTNKVSEPEQFVEMVILIHDDKDYEIHYNKK